MLILHPFNLQKGGNMPIRRIRTILYRGERTVAFFTRGDRFQVNPNGTGSTGAWLLSTKKVKAGFFVPITVAVYLRTKNQNEIWHATSTAVAPEPPDTKGRSRYRLDLIKAHLVGTASTTWFDCAETRRQDFTYLNC